MDRDGTGSGFDCELTRAVADAVRIPVIASGGAGGAADFVRSVPCRACRRRSGRLDFPLWIQPTRRSEARTPPAFYSDEVAVLIPSIDLMGGKIVQLIQGKKKALEFDDFEAWIDRFSKYPLVQLIDLDAAMGRSNNSALVREIAKRLPCQVGGGIRQLRPQRQRSRQAHAV